MGLGFTELNAYKLAYEAAMLVFELTKKFPKEETYSLTDQVRRSSRSVYANIAEGYRKRLYPKHFSSKMTDADGECAETIVHLNFAKDCSYITKSENEILLAKYQEVGRMLGGMIANPEKFLPKKQ